MNQTVTIRKENPFDHNRIIEPTEKAFEALEISNRLEGKLLNRLREELKI